MLSARSRKVVLFHPPYSGKVLGPPLGLVSLAGALREAGYTPCLIDGALHRDYLERIAGEVLDCACFGVSLLTGPMIAAAIEASRLVRRIDPAVPIVFGGWHPSLLSGQTLREDYVDIVVRNQGEKTLVEILDRLRAGKALDLVQGCWFKRDGGVRQNPDRAAAALDALPRPAYDLIDFDAYEAKSGERKLPYATSTGCPYACNYCTDMVFYNRRFNAYDVSRAVSEVVGLVREHRLREIALVDSNFLVDVHRAVAIAQGFIDSGLKFSWSFQASTDLICRMSDEEVELLGRSGVNHIGFGTESASPEVLTLMNKRHQRIPDIEEAARKCKRAGIRVTLNLIFGYPGEEERHRRETLRVMAGIAAKHENVSFSPNMFTPYPGIPIWPQLRAQGLAEPSALSEWAEIDLGITDLPWLRGYDLEALRRAIGYFLLDAKCVKARRKTTSPGARWILAQAQNALRWRLRNSFFHAPFELGLAKMHRGLTVRRSLLTGQPLSHELSRSAGT